MALLQVFKGEQLVAGEVENANHFVKRFFGLMFRKSMHHNHGLLLEPCNSIHTFSMRFPIDAVFLSPGREILSIEHSMKPGKVGKTVKGAKSVLELCGGTAEKLGLQVGDVLKIIETF